MTTIPDPEQSDPEGLKWALEVASAHWERGARADALVWLRRAGEIAADLEEDERALVLFKAAAELVNAPLPKRAVELREAVSQDRSSSSKVQPKQGVLPPEAMEERMESGVRRLLSATATPIPLTRSRVEATQHVIDDPETSEEYVIPLVTPASVRRPVDVVDEPLPDWVPDDRVVGGYYVHRPLGSGAVGAVFVARRLDDLNVHGAPLFALKMPDYEAIKEQGLPAPMAEALFRQEASALLSLPRHDNLAHLVSYDGAARTPFLVMELVRGISCENLIGEGTLTVGRALEILDGVLDGLGAMHDAGVGHLDIKPSNVVLRDDGTPVLVDFGLAGRAVRPFHATGEYGAPEVWHEELPAEATPARADVYSFACMAFELLTRRELFGAETVPALIAQHAAHDGRPDGIRALSDRGCSALVAVLAGCLRQDPSERYSVSELRPMLRGVGKALGPKKSWPL